MKKAAIGLLLVMMQVIANAESPASGEKKQGSVVYALAEKVTLRPEPQFGTPVKNTPPKVSCGQEMVITEQRGNWFSVNVPGDSLSGWVHRAAVTTSSSLPKQMEAIGLKATTIIFISGIEDSGTFQASIVEGGIRLGTKRLLAEHGTCVVTADPDSVNRVGGLSMKGLGVEQVLSTPKPWTLYFYCSSEGKFRSLPSLVAEGKPILAGPPRPKEEAVIETAQQNRVKELPKTTGDVAGTNPVRVRNPNDLSVKVALRTAAGVKDFAVAPNDSSTVYVSDGRYDIFFQYSDDPNGLYQGDSFSLFGNGVEIQLVKVVGGNYGIRKIK